MPKRKPVEPDNPVEFGDPLTVNATAFQKKPGLYQDLTIEGPVTIMKHDRPSYVLLSYKDYQKLTGKTKRALHPTQFSREELAAIAKAEVPEEYAHLDELLKDD